MKPRLFVSRGFKLRVRAFRGFAVCALRVSGVVSFRVCGLRNHGLEMRSNRRMVPMTIFIEAGAEKLTAMVLASRRMYHHQDGGPDP